MNNSLKVGDRLPVAILEPSALQLFRYSAVTWNGHRIHYDRSWAEREGHRGLVVHSHLHAANVMRALTTGLGNGWHIDRAAYRILRPAFEGDRLVATCEVSNIAPDGSTIDFKLSETNQNGDVCLDGTATASLRS